MIEAVVFLFGICIGSFLNVCIYRMPRDISVVRGRSRCNQCEKTIPWYDNIPLVSYWLLRGQCRFCKARFSMRYFWVELLTGIMWVAVWVYTGPRGALISQWVLFSLLIAVTFTDFETGYIPDQLNYPGMMAGLLLAFLFPAEFGTSNGFEALWKSFRGLLVGGASLYAMGVMGSILFRKEAMGGGDIKLLAMLGAFLGAKKALLVLFGAPFFAIPFALFTRVVKKEETFAFGPFIAMAAVWVYFYGDEFLRGMFYF